MKHITLGNVLTFVLTWSLIIFVSSCDKVETDNGDSYYISFDIGNEQFEFLLGCTELEEDPWVSETNEFSSVDLHFYAAPNVGTCFPEPNNYMWIAVRNVVVGATDSYTTVDVYYRQDGIYYFTTSALVEITDYGEIKSYNVLSTPGLVINEKLVAAGRIPNDAEVMTWVADAMAAA